MRPPTTLTPEPSNFWNTSAHVYVSYEHKKFRFGAIAVTWPKPIVAVVLSSDNDTSFNRFNDMCTPLVLENPGLDACPPDSTAKGVCVCARILSCDPLAPVVLIALWKHTAIDVSSVEPTSSTQAGIWLEEANQWWMSPAKSTLAVNTESVGSMQPPERAMVATRMRTRV